MSSPAEFRKAKKKYGSLLEELLPPTAVEAVLLLAAYGFHINVSEKSSKKGKSTKLSVLTTIKFDETGMPVE